MIPGDRLALILQHLDEYSRSFPRDSRHETRLKKLDKALSVLTAEYLTVRRAFDSPQTLPLFPTSSTDESPAIVPETDPPPARKPNGRARGVGDEK